MNEGKSSAIPCSLVNTEVLMLRRQMPVLKSKRKILPQHCHQKTHTGKTLPTDFCHMRMSQEFSPLSRARRAKVPRRKWGRKGRPSPGAPGPSCWDPAGRLQAPAWPQSTPSPCTWHCCPGAVGRILGPRANPLKGIVSGPLNSAPGVSTK